MLEIESYGDSTLFSFVFLCFFGAFFDSGTFVPLVTFTVRLSVFIFFFRLFVFAVRAEEIYGKGKIPLFSFLRETALDLQSFNGILDFSERCGNAFDMAFVCFFSTFFFVLCVLFFRGCADSLAIAFYWRARFDRFGKIFGAFCISDCTFAFSHRVP